MKLCISNIAWDAKYDEKMYQACVNLGYDGIEIAPTRIFPDEPYAHIEEAKKWSQMLQGAYGIRVFSIQSFWHGRQESIFGSERERAELLDYSKRAFAFADVIGAENVVFGNPRNRNGYAKEAGQNREIAYDFFSQLSAIAMEYNVAVSVEPNPDIYGTDFLNTTVETFDFVGQKGLESLWVNLDLGAMLYNHEDFNQIVGKGHLIGHVHISEPNLARIRKRKEHKSLNSFLKSCGYKKNISIEMGKQEKIGDVLNTMKYMHDVFKSK